MVKRSIWMLICGAVLWGQTTPPEAVPPTARAVQLPLSGRTSQPGAVATVQNPLPTGLQSVNTITSTVQVQGSYQGSVPSAQTPGPSLALSLDEAIRRGLQFNLGGVEYANSVRQAEALQAVARSALLPYVASDFLMADQQTSLIALGFNGNLIPGIPTVIGPFHYFDLRAGVSQNVLDLTNLRNYRASKENVLGTRLAAQDARDLITLAVTGAYLQIISAGARVDAVRAQVATAEQTWRQARDRVAAGLSPMIDVSRTRVELQMQQQRLTAVANDLAKLRITLGRIIGLPPGQDLTVSDTLPYAPLTSIAFDDALARAYANRADLKAAESQVRAAELTLRAAAAERYPTVAVRADYGVIGSSPVHANGTFGVAGQVNFPIFQGGRVQGDIQEAEAALAQRRAEYQDLRSGIDAEVRTAFLDLTSAASQLGVADTNRGLAQETLTQARDRFAAGVTDTLEVVQAEQTVAVAEQDYISALYAHNVAKATLARAMGQARQNMRQFLPRP